MVFSKNSVFKHSFDKAMVTLTETGKMSKIRKHFALEFKDWRQCESPAVRRLYFTFWNKTKLLCFSDCNYADTGTVSV